MYWPAAIQLFLFERSKSNGAMNRGFGSCGSIFHEVAVSVLVEPGLTPQFSVTVIDSVVYSCTCRQPLAGSAIASPPSPPKGEPISVSVLAPDGFTPRRFEAPLSCRPPETTWPPLA